MARAGRVRGIRPRHSLRQNASLVIQKRLEELLSWRGALADPNKVSDLHNMRIAAKRLRYALEMFEVCFDQAKVLLKELTEVQEALGDIHDLDVLADILRSRLRDLDTPLEEQAVAIASKIKKRGEQSNALRQVLYAQARDRRRLGLLGLLGDKVHERHEKYQAFVSEWGRSQLDALAERIERESQVTSHKSQAEWQAASHRSEEESQVASRKSEEESQVASHKSQDEPQVETTGA
jgi:uncharacterized protein (UPF0335 family)